MASRTLSTRRRRARRSDDQAPADLAQPVAEPAAPLHRSAQTLAPAEIRRLQRLVGNRAVGRMLRGDAARTPAAQTPQTVQRMIAMDSRDLYYSAESLGLGSPEQVSVWKSHIEDLTGLDATAITGDDFVQMVGADGWGEFLQGAIKQKLANNRRVFNYYGYVFKKEEDYRSQLLSEDVTNVIGPQDLLDTESDVTDTYDAKLACVLQGLINAGANIPDVSGQEGANDYERFHNYMRAQGTKDYDLDQVIYKIYTGLGLQLVMNLPTEWRYLQLAPGSYVFTMKGHNFAVEVRDRTNPAERYVPKDIPQRIVTTYRPNEVIRYVWKV